MCPGLGFARRWVVVFSCYPSGGSRNIGCDERNAIPYLGPKKQHSRIQQTPQRHIIIIIQPEKYSVYSLPLRLINTWCFSIIVFQVNKIRYTLGRWVTHRPSLPFPSLSDNEAYRRGREHTLVFPGLK